VTTYAATCLGNGHTPCPWTHTGRGLQAAAERHVTAEGHAVTTHVSGGMFDRRSEK
jgi:hypothetical protein